jgi:hypothetical protein
LDVDGIAALRWPTAQGIPPQSKGHSMSDDGPPVVIDNPEDAVKFIAQWIRENETELEQLAAETGKRQERTVGMANRANQAMLLQIRITCEPRQFAKHSFEGDWAKLFEPDIEGRI